VINAVQPRQREKGQVKLLLLVDRLLDRRDLPERHVIRLIATCHPQTHRRS
jgi:hypothetical protein